MRLGRSFDVLARGGAQVLRGPVCSMTMDKIWPATHHMASSGATGPWKMQSGIFALISRRPRYLDVASRGFPSRPPRFCWCDTRPDSRMTSFASNDFVVGPSCRQCHARGIPGAVGSRKKAGQAGPHRTRPFRIQSRSPHISDIPRSEAAVGITYSAEGVRETVSEEGSMEEVENALTSLSVCKRTC